MSEGKKCRLSKIYLFLASQFYQSSLLCWIGGDGNSTAPKSDRRRKARTSFCRVASSEVRRPTVVTVVVGVEILTDGIFRILSEISKQNRDEWSKSGEDDCIVG